MLWLALGCSTAVLLLAYVLLAFDPAPCAVQSVHRDAGPEQVPAQPWVDPPEETLIA